MKHSLKLAAVAVAMAVSSQGAFASSASDLIVQVYDPTSTRTLDIDTGLSVLTTALTTQETANLSAAISAFTGTAGVGASSQFKFDLFGGSSTSGLGDIGLGAVPGTGVTKTQLTGIFGSTFETPILNTIGTTTGAVFGYTITAAGAATTAGGYLATTTNFNVTTLGNAVNPTSLVYFSAPTTTNSTKTLITSAVSLNYTTGTLSLGTASATPEPGTYALMAAGLLAVGAIVRRRRSA